MKIAIIGSRNFKNLEKVEDKLYNLQSIYGFRSLKIISGGSGDVDKTAEKWCRTNDVDIEVICPIKLHIGAYFLYRDVEIAIKCTEMVAFWDGISRGTKFTFEYARARGKPVEVVRE